MKRPAELVHLAELLGQQARGGFASDHLAAHFRMNRALRPEEKAQTARWFYTLIRQSRRLAFALDCEFESADPSRLAGLFLFLQGVLDERSLGLLGLGFDPQRARQRFDSLLGLEDAPTHFAFEHSLSPAVASALIESLGEDTKRFLDACALPPPRTIRANLQRGSREKLALSLEEEGFGTSLTPLAAHGLIVTSGGDLFQSLAFRDGRFEVQDEGSQLIAEIVAPPPGGLVVDVCAGAGGKTLALASLLRGKGRVLALDIYERKLEALRQRARRAGASTVEAVRIEPEGALPERVIDHLRRADRILVDAPCSGLGVLRRNPEAGARLGVEDLERLPKLQAEILGRFAPHLKPGARLIYSTCTVLEAENEGILDALARRDPGLAWVRVSEILGGSRASPITARGGMILKLRPDLHGTDGFFAGVLRRPR